MQNKKEKIKDRNVCFHCGGRLVWQSDFDFCEYGIEGEGLVHYLRCSDCGADIEYFIKDKEEQDEEVN